MQGVEIIDVDVDPRETRRIFWRRMLRYAVPFVSIVLIAAGLVASSYYTSSMNRTDALTLSRDLITALNERVLTEVRAYLVPARDAVGSLAAAMPQDPMSDHGRAVFERMALDVLGRHPQLAALFLGTPNGDFLMVRRNDPGSADTKLIHRTGQTVETVWTRRDANGVVVATERDATDRYDPRTREWYRDAAQADDIVWSEVYVFFTDKTPGITASTGIRRDGDAPSAVVGADIRLDSLSAFLEGLEDQARGKLAIVNGEGQIIAFHDPRQVLLEDASGARPRTVRELDVPALAEAFDRLRVEGPTNAIVEIDEDRHVFGAASLYGAVSRDWWLMLLAPESAYLGFVAANSRRGLIASSGIIVLAVVLAGLLAYQGVVGERTARAVRAGRERLAAQRRIFDDLAGFSGLPDPADEHDLHRASEILARAEGARRAAFWRFGRDGRSLVCVDAFETETRGHTSGATIHAADCGELFAEIAEGQTIEIADTRGDARAAGLQLTYLQAVGTTSLASVPVTLGGRVWGAVWIEDPDPGAAITGDRSVARSVANLLAPRLKRLAEAEADAQTAAAPGTPPSAAVSAERYDGLPAGDVLRRVSLVEQRHDIGTRDADFNTIAATVFAGTTVLALKFLDDRALAAGVSGVTDAAVMHEVAGLFEQVADAKGVPYVKILTEQILAVDGFRDDVAAAAGRLIDVALDVRERCAAIFLASGRGPQFTIGMDSGTVFGAAVGSGAALYNVWGEPVRVANALADTADPGTIQVSETTYELLREACVFRRRGRFYIGRLGEMTTFTLRGRL